MTSRTLRTTLLAAATIGVVTLTGCSSSGGSSSDSGSPAAAVTGTPAGGPHSAADVAFATDMIPHHAQAVAMSTMAATRADSAAVKSLAARIESEQDPEIATMSGWLAGWGETVPATGSAGSAAMGSMAPGSMPGGGHSGTGMMSADDMAALGQASGPAFDRMWVSMMIAHHTGALAMASTEIADGSNPDAIALARSIVTGQTAEIATMKTLLTTLPTD